MLDDSLTIDLMNV